MHLTTTIACIVVVFSTICFASLWFWVVHRELHAKKKTVDASRYQLTASRQQFMRARDGPDRKAAEELLTRSNDIYHQSLELYNDALHKPWNYLPAIIMGFRQLSGEGKSDKAK